MTSDIRNILGHTNIFDNLNEIDEIERIESSKYRVDKEEKSYVFALYELEQFEKLKMNHLLMKFWNMQALTHLRYTRKA